jgi:dTDP-4-dehydrorhamnose reductase
VRLLVTGSSGMLGLAVVAAASAHKHDVIKADSHYNIATTSVVLPCDAVINCAGCINARGYPVSLMVATNSLGPWNLARMYADKHVVLVSTDCVFSGDSPSPRTIAMNPDPIDLYGRTKLVGEVAMDNVSVVRTSFIGLNHGLLNWTINELEHEHAIEGWNNAWWSGAHVNTVAQALVGLAEREPAGQRLLHLSMGHAVSKYELLKLIQQTLNLPGQVRESRAPRTIMRALEPTIQLPHITDWIHELHRDYNANWNSSSMQDAEAAV